MSNIPQPVAPAPAEPESQVLRNARRDPDYCPKDTTERTMALFDAALADAAADPRAPYLRLAGALNRLEEACRDVSAEEVARGDLGEVRAAITDLLAEIAPLAAAPQSTEETANYVRRADALPEPMTTLASSGAWGTMHTWSFPTPQPPDAQPSPEGTPPSYFHDLATGAAAPPEDGAGEEITDERTYAEGWQAARASYRRRMERTLAAHARQLTELRAQLDARTARDEALAEAARLRSKLSEAETLTVPSREDEWGEDDSAVLWWRYPIVEPPYCGTPLDSDWPFEDEDRARLWWTPIPGNRVHDAIAAALASPTTERPAEYCTCSAERFALNNSGGVCEVCDRPRAPEVPADG